MHHHQSNDQMIIIHNNEKIETYLSSLEASTQVSFFDIYLGQSGWVYQNDFLLKEIVKSPRKQHSWEIYSLCLVPI